MVYGIMKPRVNMYVGVNILGQDAMFTISFIVQALMMNVSSNAWTSVQHHLDTSVDNVIMVIQDNIV